MKIHFSQIVCVALLFSIFSCRERSRSHSSSGTYSLEIIDSIEVDYLGDMRLIDYDEREDKYLILDNSNRIYLEVSDKGDVVNRNELSPDGLNAVRYVSGLGYLDGKVAVLTPTDGYYLFQDTTIVGKIAIPYPYRTVVYYEKLGVFSEGNRIYFQKPWPLTMDVSMNNWEFYEKLYGLPIIESLDKTTSDTLSVLTLPESSAFLDGQVHGILLPSYSRFDDLLLLTMKFRPEIYVYQKNGVGYEYLKTVEIEISDWVSYDPVEKDNSAQFYNGMNSKQVGVVSDILKVDDFFVVVYSKGVPEEKMPVGVQDPNTGGLNRRKANPFYAVILDKDFNKLGTDIPFPSTSNFPNVVNKDGELVVSKIAGLSETEDEGVILYKLKLKVE